MSWSTDITGTKDAVAKRFAEQMDKMAANYYAGKPEGDDIAACKARGLALIEACDLSSDGYADWNAVNVKASGSHSTNSKGVLMGSFQLSVTRTSLAL